MTAFTYAISVWNTQLKSLDFIITNIFNLTLRFRLKNLLSWTCVRHVTIFIEEIGHFAIILLFNFKMKTKNQI